MERWKPLLDIFLSSATPESDASLWLKSYSGSASSTGITTLSFISLLTKPLLVDSSTSPSPSSPPPPKTVMWIQTLPNMVQSRILSFLLLDHSRFCAADLSKLAKNVLRGEREVDFWVRRAARNLLDVLSQTRSGYDRVASDEQSKLDDEFQAIPSFLKHAAAAAAHGGGSLLPWLPLNPSSTDSNADRLTRAAASDDDDSSVEMVEVGDSKDDKLDNDIVLLDAEVDGGSGTLDTQVQKMAETLKGQIVCFESTSKTVSLASEMRNLCMGRGRDSRQILALIEPWNADDQTAAILISQLTKPDDEELGWPSHVLSSIVLPKLIILEEPASRVLIAATVEYSKLKPRAAVNALLFPLLHRREGINRHQCDIITKIIKECLHPAHVSAFFQSLLTAENSERRFLTAPGHRHLLLENMVWTESAFSMFKNVLDHNIQLTQDSVDHLVYQAVQLAEKYAKSLKFGNFLLSLVNKCRSMLIPHKQLLSGAVGHTNTLVTKSVIAKLASV
uniref:Fanconi Anaemia group E protein C-terminal domain-containing protein n=1 Tax=Kalanchoe fedtschenkoi TaxID=63787 RepID=A0A7N0VG22_KALFE